MQHTALIFAKYPQAGSVKTRMVPPLTFEQAAALHEASLRAVCEGAARIDALRLVLACAPDDATKAFREDFRNRLSNYWPQGEGDLGERLSRGVDRAFAKGADGVILLGADSPTLPRTILEETIRSLSIHDGVLGPSEDGGYYLLGLRRPMPSLFERIDWGGSAVASQTRERAIEAGMGLHELPLWYDLDTFADLQRVAHDLRTISVDKLPALSEFAAYVRTLVDQV